MFQSGNLIHITDFDFSSVNSRLTPLESLRDKYILVVENFDHSTLFCCFTTTMKEHVMFHKIAKPGCNKAPYAFHVFHFDNSLKCHCYDTNFKFDRLTFIAGNKGQVFEFDLPEMYNTYNLNDKIKRIGKLSDEMFFDILHCIHNSKTIEDEYREKLFAKGDAVMRRMQKTQEEEE